MQAGWASLAQEKLALLWAEVRLQLVACALLIGSLGCFLWPASPPLGLLIIAAIILGSVTVMRWRHVRAFDLPDTHVAVPFLLFAMIAMMAWTTVYTRHLVSTPMLARDLTVRDMTATISRLEPSERGARLWLEHLSVDQKDTPDWVAERLETVERARVTVRQSELGGSMSQTALQVGDRIQLTARLMAPSRPFTPMSYDFERHAYFRGIGAYGYAMGGITRLSGAVENTTWSEPRWITAYRRHLSNQITHHIDQPEQGIMLALVTGVMGAIDDDTREALQLSGLAHILSISGVHVAMVAAVIFLFFRYALALSPWLAHRVIIPKLAAFLTIPIIWWFMVLVGAAVATQRAVLMTSFVMVGVMMDRPILSLRTVALIASVLMITQPDSVIRAGFHMSFAAVIALVWWAQWRFGDAAQRLPEPWDPNYEKPRTLITWRHKLWRRTRSFASDILMTTVVASTATIPFAIQHFQTVATYAVLGNMLATPLMSVVIMPVTIIMTVFGWVPGVGSLLLPMAAWATRLTLDLSHLIATFPWAQAHVMPFPPMIFALMVMGLMACVVIPKSLDSKGFARLGIFLMVIGAIAAAVVFRTPPIFLADRASDTMVLYERDGHTALVWPRRDKFARDLVIRSLAEPKAHDLSHQSLIRHDLPASWASHVACDHQGCVVAAKGHTGRLYLPWVEEAVPRDCWTMQDKDIMIAFWPIYDDACRPHQDRIIDYNDFNELGSIAVYSGKNGWQITQRYQTPYGHRPW